MIIHPHLHAASQALYEAYGYGTQAQYEKYGYGRYKTEEWTRLDAMWHAWIRLEFLSEGDSVFLFEGDSVSLSEKQRILRDLLQDDQTGKDRL